MNPLQEFVFFSSGIAFLPPAASNGPTQTISITTTLDPLYAGNRHERRKNQAIDRRERRARRRRS